MEFSVSSLKNQRFSIHDTEGDSFRYSTLLLIRIIKADYRAILGDSYACLLLILLLYFILFAQPVKSIVIDKYSAITQSS